MADVGDEVFEGQVLARIGSAGLETAREQAAAGGGVCAAAGQHRGSRRSTPRGMEASRADADMQRARMQVDRAQKVFERQKTLHKAGATPKLKYEAAVAGVRGRGEGIRDHGQGGAGRARRRAERHGAARGGEESCWPRRARSSRTRRGRSKRPRSARRWRASIVGRKGELGKSVRDSGDQLFQIATDLFTLEVVAEPKPDDLKRIHPGQQALVLVLDLQSAGMPGVVKAIKDPEVIVEFNSNAAGDQAGDAGRRPAEARTSRLHRTLQ